MSPLLYRRERYSGPVVRVPVKGKKKQRKFEALWIGDGNDQWLVVRDRPGRKPELTADDKRTIVERVADLVVGADGMRITDALETVASETGWSYSTVRNLWYKHRNST